MNIWTIILAAGESSRFGGPKALADWKGQTLLERAISCAPDKSKVLVVTGAHKMNVPEPCQNLYNLNWKMGMGTSIAAGIIYVEDQGADIAIVVPVDQPFITKEHLNWLVAATLQEKKCALTQDADIVGPPAAVPKECFGVLKSLDSNGLKSVISDYVLCQANGMLQDIDTNDDLEKITVAHRAAEK